jgi:hypothetical protein
LNSRTFLIPPAPFTPAPFTFIDTENDFLLRESAQILSDFVDLQAKSSGEIREISATDSAR